MDRGCVAVTHGVMKQPMSMQCNPSSLKEYEDLQAAREMGSSANTDSTWEPFKGCSLEPCWSCFAFDCRRQIWKSLLHCTVCCAE